MNNNNNKLEYNETMEVKGKMIKCAMLDNGTMILDPNDLQEKFGVKTLKEVYRQDD